MATFKRFEDIQAWQLGRELNRVVYALTSEGAFARDFALRDQIRRASISVASNVAEGYGRRSPRDFARFLVIAAGSVAEVQTHLYLALDLGYVSDTEFTEALGLTSRIAAALRGLTAYLRSAPHAAEPTLPYAPPDPSQGSVPQTPEPLNAEPLNPTPRA